jgi:precorrin-6A/cobalt-precorrin-6A reductase
MPKSHDCADNFVLAKNNDNGTVSEAMLPSIWLIGGTCEGLELARQIAQRALPCAVSVTTTSAQVRYPKGRAVRVVVCQFDFATLAQFLVAQNIAVILDASHPHAVEISQLAMQAATTFSIPYLRFERPLVSACDQDGVQKVDSLAAVLCDRYLLQRHVLLTLGAKALPQFKPWQSRSTLFARILPSQSALQTATDAGFLPDRLMAFRPPISIEMEMALWQHWRIEQVITKASGQPGGEAIKCRVAAALKVNLVIIERPPVVYLRQTNDLGDAIAFCQQTLTQRHGHNLGLNR